MMELLFGYEKRLNGATVNRLLHTTLNLLGNEFWIRRQQLNTLLFYTRLKMQKL